MEAYEDLYDFERFLMAQEQTYETALSEIRSGRKRSHWMWFIFPQFSGLGFSGTSHKYLDKWGQVHLKIFIAVATELYLNQMDFTTNRE